MGCAASVEKAWLDDIAAAQQPDGGWANNFDAEKGVTDGRPTVYALWALLESAMPDAPQTPMIHKAAEKAAEKAPEKAAEKAPVKAPVKK